MEIVRWLMEMGDIPSFCTAATAPEEPATRFMSLCKSKQILNCCHPNALMTLMEYLQDYASPKTKEIGMKLIEKNWTIFQMKKSVKSQKSICGISKTDREIFGSDNKKRLLEY